MTEAFKDLPFRARAGEDSWEYKVEHNLDQEERIPISIPGACGMARRRTEKDKGPSAEEQATEEARLKELKAKAKELSTRTGTAGMA